MSTYDDDRIEFDFFDEPETEEAPRTRRRRGSTPERRRRRPRGPGRP